MSSVLDDLNTVERKVWALWEHAAATGADAPGALATLATARIEGGASARTVFLRGAARDASTLTFWTNRTSRKVEELEREPKAALVFWFPEDQLQVRVDATVKLRPAHDDAWTQLSTGARLNYLAYAAPDASLASPEDNEARPDPKQFAVLEASVTRIDALSLAHRPHRRAILDNKGVNWVAP